MTLSILMIHTLPSDTGDTHISLFEYLDDVLSSDRLICHTQSSPLRCSLCCTPAFETHHDMSVISDSMMNTLVSLDEVSPLCTQYTYRRNQHLGNDVCGRYKSLPLE
jgi:hypothetical protein